MQSKRNTTNATLGSISPSKRKANKSQKSDDDRSNNELNNDYVLSRIDSYSKDKDNRLQDEITELQKLLHDHNASNKSDTSSVPSSSSVSMCTWSRDSIHQDVLGKFTTTKLDQDEISNNIDKRIKRGLQLDQDDSLDHKRNLLNLRYLSALTKEDFVQRVYPNQPENIELLLKPRSDYSNDSDVHYVVTYKGDNTLPRPGDTSNLGEREKFLKEKGEQPNIAVVGSSTQMIENGYVNKDVVDTIVKYQIISRGYDDNNKAKRLAKSKAVRQLAEAQTAITFICKPGKVLEHSLAVPSHRLRQLTDGRFMLKLMAGEIGKELVSIIDKYISGDIRTITLDTWPKMDDVLRKIDELLAMIHSKHEKGGVCPYLDSLLNDVDKYLGFNDCNACPLADVMREITTKILEMIDDNKATRVQILELLNNTNLTDPYFGPPDEVYAQGAIDALELMANNESTDATSTLISMRYSNVEAILESDVPTIKQWSDNNLRVLKEIPGGVVELEGNNTIEARKMKLVLFRDKYLILVRGSSFCMFDGKQELRMALRFCLEYVEEAVLRYCLGLLSVEGLTKVINMMQSYAMLVVGPSGSVSNPNGSAYDPIHLVLPEGVVGALEGDSGSNTAGAAEIEAAFDGKLHYYGIVSMVGRLGFKFNQLMKIMGSRLTVKKLDNRYIFVDGNEKYFDQQFDHITVERDVGVAAGHLKKLSTEMIQCFLNNEREGMTHEELLKMVELIGCFDLSLYEGAAVTNNAKRSRKRRTDKIIEYLIGVKRQDLIDLVNKNRNDTTILFWKWLTAILNCADGEEYWVKLPNLSVFVLPQKHHLYKNGSLIRNYPSTDWRKKVVMDTNLNWHKYGEAQDANAIKRYSGDTIGKVNEAAAEASHAQNQEGNNYEEGEEDVYGNPFG